MFVIKKLVTMNRQRLLFESCCSGVVMETTLLFKNNTMLNQDHINLTENRTS